VGRKSTLSQMPPEVTERLNALLNDGSYTQKQVVSWLNEYLIAIRQQPVITERIVNRYAAKMEKIGSRLKQSREVASMWIGKLGNEPQGQVGQLLNEVVRNLAFDTAMSLSDTEEPVDPKLIKELAIAIEKLEKAASDNEKRAAQIRQQARAEAAEELTSELKNDGISVEVEQSIKRILLGK